MSEKDKALLRLAKASQSFELNRSNENAREYELALDDMLQIERNEEQKLKKIIVEWLDPNQKRMLLFTFSKDSEPQDLVSAFRDAAALAKTVDNNLYIVWNDQFQNMKIYNWQYLVQKMPELNFDFEIILISPNALMSHQISVSSMMLRFGVHRVFSVDQAIELVEKKKNS